MATALEEGSLHHRRVREALEVAREYVRDPDSWSRGIESPTGAVDDMGLSCDPSGPAVGLSMVGALRRACGDRGTLLAALALVHGAGPGLPQALHRAESWEGDLNRSGRTHEEVMDCLEKAVKGAAKLSPPPKVRGRAHGLRLIEAAVWRERSLGEEGVEVALSVCSQEEFDDWCQASRTLARWRDEGEAIGDHISNDETAEELSREAAALDEADANAPGWLPRKLNAATAVHLDVAVLEASRQRVRSKGGGAAVVDGVVCSFKKNAIFEVKEILLEIHDKEVDAVVVHVGEGESLPKVHLNSKRQASLVITGKGRASGKVSGPGDGDMLRFGDGDGDSERLGRGNGNSVRGGKGTGGSHRSGKGFGHSIRTGREDGPSKRTGLGCGDSVREGTGKGVSRREGTSVDSIGDAINRGPGDAERIGPGRGLAISTGGGFAVHDGKSVGHAVGPRKRPSPKGPKRGMSP